MAKSKNKKQTPLTLEGLAKYNQDVLFPYMEDRFAIKKDLENFATKDDFKQLASKEELTDFKNEILTSQDEIIKKLDAILQENSMRDLQDKKQKALWAIIIKSLKKHNILSAKELSEITKLEFF